MEKALEISDARSEDCVRLMRSDCGSELARDLQTCQRLEFMVEVVGLKRKRDDFELINSGSVDLEEEPIAARKHARSLAVKRTLPSPPAACKIKLSLDSDPDDNNDCVITGFVLGQVTHPRAPAGCNILGDYIERVSVGSVMPHSTLTGARASCNTVQVTHDSGAVEDDDDCVITGWVSPRAVLIRDFGFEYEFRNSEVVDELRASEADDDEFSDSEYSVGSIPASGSARESDDEFSASESEEEFFSPVPECNADGAIFVGMVCCTTVTGTLSGPLYT